MLSIFFEKNERSAKKKLKKVNFLNLEGKESKQKLVSAQNGQIIGSGTNTSKNLANTPVNICTPTYLANQAKLLV